MSDAPEMRQNRVRGACPPPRAARGRRAHQRRSENDECTDSPKSRASEPGVLGEDLVFDSGKLHSQLADLLKLYLARASEPDAIEKCSAKDAISCAKTLTGMMSDVQSGKPASVDTDTQWPRLESSSVGRGPACPLKSRLVGRRRVPRHLHNAKSGNGGPRVAALQPESTSIRTLEDAVSVVCMSDEETQILEPWARLVARIQKLCTETQKRLDAAQTGDPPVGRGLRAPPDSENEDSPVGARHAVPSNEGGDDSVVQPRPGGQAFRAGSSDDKTRAKALDYRESRRKSRAGEPGLPNGGSPSPSPNPSPLIPSSAPPAPPKKRRRTLYTLGTSLRSGNYRLESRRYRASSPTTHYFLHPACGRSAPRTPT